MTTLTSAPMTTPQALATRLRKQAAEFGRLAAQTAARRTEDRVHRLRVLTRRLRSALALAARMADSPSLDDLRRRMRRIGRALGLRRSLDVADLDLKALGGPPVPELEERRLEAGADIARRLRKRAELAELARRGAAALESEGRWGGRVRKLLARRAERLEGALEAASDGAKDSAHRLRIEAKKTRYLLEALGGSAAESRLKSLQRELGRAHDYEVLLSLLPEGHAARAEAESRELAHRRAGSRIQGAAVRAAASALRGAAR